jgi:predicted alpha-1,6-mannanase (GH76 family)
VLEPDFYAHSELAVNVLQQWYNPHGLWNSCGWWNAANCLEAVESVVEASNGQEYQNVLSRTFEHNAQTNFLNEFYDDQGWWAEAWIRAFDLTGEARYLAMAKTIFADMQGGWDSHCGGGIWWSKERRYKNAIANELFLLIAIRLHQRIPQDSGRDSYLDWAQREWNWFRQTGMINRENLVNDGLTENCENNHRATWTYNQGVLLGGLVELYKSTGDTNALAQAVAVADAATRTLVDSRGVLRELSEGRGLRGQDVPQFKGIFMRHLAELYDVTRKTEYRMFLVSNANSIWNHNRDNQNRFGGRWSGPIDKVDAIRQTSAMRVITALANPVTTDLVFIKPVGSPAFRHETGTLCGATAWKCDNTVPAGYALISPELASLPAGIHALHCRLFVNALSLNHLVSSSSSSSQSQPNPSQTLPILARLEVLGPDGSLLAARAIRWEEFASANQPRDFSLAFTNITDRAPVQFRLYWNSAPGSPDLIITDLWTDGHLAWTSANLEHELGQLDGFDHWCADPVRNKASGFLARGPGTTDLPAGDYDVCFELKVDNFNLDDSLVATISVADAASKKTLSSRDLRRSDFQNTLYQTFRLHAKVVAGQQLDFQTFWHAGPQAPRLSQRCVFVMPLASPR